MPAPLVAIGTVFVVRGVRLVAVPLSKIIRPMASELIPSRLKQLKNGFNTLDEILSDPHWQGNPIALTRSGNMFNIIDGRHRVTLAFERAKSSLGYVWARLPD